MNDPKRLFVFRKKYFGLFIGFLLIEIFIALFIHDKIIRPFFGDFLVVFLLYYFLRSFWNASTLTIAISVLIFAFATEFLQYFGVVDLLGLRENRLAVILIGTVFSVGDLIAYTLGIISVYFLDQR